MRGDSEKSEVKERMRKNSGKENKGIEGRERYERQDGGSSKKVHRAVNDGVLIGVTGPSRPSALPHSR